MHFLVSVRASAWAWLCFVWALAADHPALTTIIVGSLLSRLLKPRTPEQYARIAEKHPTWLFARVAAFMQLFGAVFTDTVKVQKIVLEKILRGPPRVSIVLIGALLVLPSGCAFLTRENARSALDAVQVTCVFSSQLTDEKSVADACGVARDLLPLLRDLIGQREAAMRSGVHWPGASDAGADADASDGAPR